MANLPWTVLNPLPLSRNFCAAAVHGDFLYVVGGASQVAAPFSTYRKVVNKARISPDGDLGPWTAACDDLLAGKVAPALLITREGVMYVMGGLQPDISSDPSAGEQILVGKLDVDGNVRGGVLVATKSLPQNFRGTNLATNGEFVYAIGGTHETQALTFKTQAGNWTAEETILGLTSASTATVRSDSDSGTTGTLTLDDVVGTFVDNEILRGSVKGRALVNGSPSALKLKYDNQVVNFISAQVIHGITSGASATIASDVDGGTSGTLTLSGVSGVFANNEKLAVTYATAGTPGTAVKLDYINQAVGDWTLGETVTGAAGATGVIAAGSDLTPATGTLILTSVTGDFVNGETITGSAASTTGEVALTQYKELPYTAQAVNFVAAQIIWGLTSGATATIMADTDGGTTGTLKIKLWTGTFTALEPIAVQKADVDDTLFLTLAYDGQTGNFASLETITGGTSGAVSQIESGTDTGTAGVLTLATMSGGPFQNNEAVTGTVVGSALADGANVLAEAEVLTIYRSRLSPDGSLNAWSSIGTLPDNSVGAGTLVAVGNMLYFSSAGVLWFARADGLSLDTWNSVTIPAVLANHSMLAIGHFLVILGGDVSDTDKGTVYVLPLDSDGVPRRIWYGSSSLPGIRSRMGATTKGERIFLVGGRSTATAQTTVWTALFQAGAISAEKITL